MSKKRIVSYTIDNLPKSKTNWDKVRKMTDKEIARRAKSDPDAPLLTKKELSEFRRVNLPEEIDVKSIREDLHFSQSVFASYFGISKRTLQDWEQNRRIPRGPARVLLTVISKEPRAVFKALEVA